MKKLILFTCLLATALAAGTEELTPEPPKSSTDKPITTTAPSNTTTSQTTSSTSTATPTTPTTTKLTTPTTTAKPTTTATPAPTTPKPTPAPKEPEVIKLNVTEGNKTCLMINMAVTFQVSYESVNGTKIGQLNVDKNAKSNGTCEGEEEKIMITWLENMFTMTFNKNATKKNFMLSEVSGKLILDDANFPDAKEKNKTINFLRHKPEFVTPLSMSYKCDKKEYFNMTEQNITIATLVVSKLRMEAFRNTNSHEFSSAEDCEPFQASGIVPIAVGCSLVILIIIVLVAYLIGRRRSQARGYLSMFSERQREEEYIPMKNLSCFGQ